MQSITSCFNDERPLGVLEHYFNPRPIIFLQRQWKFYKHMQALKNGARFYGRSIRLLDDAFKNTFSSSIAKIEMSIAVHRIFLFATANRVKNKMIRISSNLRHRKVIDVSEENFLKLLFSSEERNLPISCFSAAFFKIYQNFDNVHYYFPFSIYFSWTNHWEIKIIGSKLGVGSYRSVYNLFVFQKVNDLWQKSFSVIHKSVFNNFEKLEMFQRGLRIQREIFNDCPEIHLTSPPRLMGRNLERLFFEYEQVRYNGSWNRFFFSNNDHILIAKQVVRILEKMHERGYIHGDLHYGNIFCNIDTYGKFTQAFIADFDLTNRMESPFLELLRCNCSWWDLSACHFNIFTPLTDLYGLAFSFFLLISGNTFNSMNRIYFYNLDFFYLFLKNFCRKKFLIVFHNFSAIKRFYQSTNEENQKKIHQVINAYAFIENLIYAEKRLYEYFRNPENRIQFIDNHLKNESYQQIEDILQLPNLQSYKILLNNINNKPKILN